MFKLNVCCELILCVKCASTCELADRYGESPNRHGMSDVRKKDVVKVLVNMGCWMLDEESLRRILTRKTRSGEISRRRRPRAVWL